MLLEFAIRIVSVVGAVWVSLALFYTNGEEVLLRLWWQCSHTLGLEGWRSYVPVSEERLTEVAQSPATSTALASLSILFFMAALYSLRRPRLRRRRWPGVPRAA